MIQVTAAVIIRDGKVLVARRNQGVHLGGKWEFPCGKLEPNETMAGSLKRGLKEEFSIEVAVDSFICMNKHSYSFGELELFAYRVHIISGDFKLKEHVEIRWILPSELLSYDFAEAHIPVCKRVIEDYQGEVLS